jgi:hypothetical protein
MPRSPLPNIDEIDHVVASVYSTELHHMVDFQVPEEYLPRIWAALQPAKPDPRPAKWIVLGDLAITKKDGAAYYVGLYKLPKSLGAFSAGPTFERRDYYRGGNSKELEKALNEAFEASKQQK